MKKAIVKSKWSEVPASFRQWLKTLSSDKNFRYKSFYIHGTNGTGKTYLLHLLAKQMIIKYNVYPIYIRYSELLRKFFNYKSEQVNIKNLLQCKVLFLDEFGKGNDNDFYLSQLEDLFEYRIMNYLPMYLAGNYLIADMSERGLKSIADRLSDKDEFEVLKYGTKSKRRLL